MPAPSGRMLWPVSPIEKIESMKNEQTTVKKVVSVAAGAVLAVSLYANAVYQPRNENVLKQALDRELQAVVAGDVELEVVGDGFVVVERTPIANSQSAAELTEQVAQLEVEIAANVEKVEELVSVNSEATEGRIAAAYSGASVKKLAQAGPTQAQIEAAAAVRARITGLPVGRTIGLLSAIASNPFVAAAIIEVANANLQPGEVAAAANNASGLSAPAQTLVTTTGVAGSGGLATAVSQAAASNTGNTVNGTPNSVSP